MIGIVKDYKSYYPKDNMTYEEMVYYQWSIDLTLGLFFGLVGVVFFVVSMMTIRLIRNYFPPMYLAHKKKMYTAVFGLSVPLIFHAIMDLMNLSAEYLEYKNNHVTIYNCITLLFGYIIPVGFQFSSLVFGFIRNKNDKNKFRINGNNM